MKLAATAKLPKIVTGLIATIIALVPFQAFITVWPASNFGHYTAFRLWDEVALAVAGILALGLLWQHPGIWNRLKKLQIIWLITAYIILELLTGLIAFARHNVDAEALGYGLIVNLRFLLFFALCLIAAAQSDWLKKHWRQLLFIPAAIVVAFGLLQHFVLPNDFLHHFGYSVGTIFPYETINHNVTYIRIMSTLRGANPLGAYLVIIVVASLAEFLRQKRRNFRLAYGLLFIGSLATLFYSYSRSAWLGAALAVIIVLAVMAKSRKLKLTLAFGLTGLIVVAVVLGVVLKNNSHFENILTHTQQNSAIKTTSDQGHASALKAGLKDVLYQPLGLGPGTAGPASVYNNHPARIAENYFVQVAQEVGWLGLIIFLLINWLVVKELWLNRTDRLSLILLASLVGIMFINLLSHAWTDDTLSYIWWGLAGIALAPTLLKIKNHETKTK
jgi:hypothetical protein